MSIINKDDVKASLHKINSKIGKFGWKLHMADYGCGRLSIELEIPKEQDLALTLPAYAEKIFFSRADFPTNISFCLKSDNDRIWEFLTLFEKSILDSEVGIDIQKILDIAVAIQYDAVCQVIYDWTDQYEPTAFPAYDCAVPDFIDLTRIGITISDNVAKQIRPFVTITADHCGSCGSYSDIPKSKEPGALIIGYRAELGFSESKVSIKEYLDTGDLTEIERFILEAHYEFKENHYVTNYYIVGFWLKPTLETLHLLPKIVKTKIFTGYFDNICKCYKPTTTREDAILEFLDAVIENTEYADEKELAVKMVQEMKKTLYNLGVL